MYIGVMLMLIGEAAFFSSVSLWIYTAFIFIAFHLCQHEKRGEGRLARQIRVKKYSCLDQLLCRVHQGPPQMQSERASDHDTIT